MKDQIFKLIRSAPPANVNVVPRSLPIPFFGKYDMAHVGTISLNPSHQEFLDKKGNWLTGKHRRLESLQSLEATVPNELSDSQIGKVIERCYNYFDNDAAYWTWFSHLERLFNPHRLSYRDGSVVHLDLSPWATDPVWSGLNDEQRCTLKENGGPFLKGILRDHKIEILVLNGASTFESVSTTLGINAAAVKITRSQKRWKFFEVDCALSENKRLKLIGWNQYIQRTGTIDALREFLASHLGDRSYNKTG